MPRVAVILGISVATLLLTCGYSPQARAQALAPQVQTGARKFDEFGKVGHCDLGARLDNLAIHLQQIPAAEAYLIAYAPTGRGERLLELTKDYLVNTRGFVPDRIKTIYGGRNIDLTQPKIELWVVPKGAQPPEPEKYETNIDSFKGLFADEPGYDRIEIEYEGEGMGPGIGDTVDLSFVDILQEQKNAVGYMVVYSGELEAPGAWRRIAQREIAYFKALSLDASRLKVIFGGYLKESRVQLWVSPSGEPPPVPEAGPEPPLNKIVRLPGFDGYELAKEQNQAAVFKRLLEILRDEKNARVFAVVRLGQPQPEEPSENVEPPPAQESTTAPVEESTEVIEEPEPEPEPADLTKVVEKWQHDLTDTHKISADRLIVVFVPRREFDSTELDLWIVPKGQPLPDPNEEPKDPMDEFPEAASTNAQPRLNHLKVDQQPAHEASAKRP